MDIKDIRIKNITVYKKVKSFWTGKTSDKYVRGFYNIEVKYKDEWVLVNVVNEDEHI